MKKFLLNYRAGYTLYLCLNTIILGEGQFEKCFLVVFSFEIKNKRGGVSFEIKNKWVGGG